MNFDILEICVKENVFLRKKELVHYVVKCEEIQELFKDHSEFPKCMSGQGSSQGHHLKY
jgi:hypothetical protein